MMTLKTKILIVSALIINVFALQAQDKKIAVFDPVCDCDAPIKEVVREEISTAIVNTAGYAVLERSLINKVLEENKFQQGGLVDDSQISEVGKRMGANYVLVTSITKVGTNYYISIKVTEVLTAKIEKQKTASTKKGMNDLIGVLQAMLKEMFKKTETVENTPKIDVAQNADTRPLIVKRARVYQDLESLPLTTKDVSNLMANTNAIWRYNKGVSQNRAGDGLLYTGLGVLVVGACAVGIPLMTEIYDDGITLFTAVGVGGAMAITGGILKGVGIKNLKKSVNTYNTGKNRAYNAEYRFNFAPNGVGLVINF